MENLLTRVQKTPNQFNISTTKRTRNRKNNIEVRSVSSDNLHQSSNVYLNPIQKQHETYLKNPLSSTYWTAAMECMSDIIRYTTWTLITIFFLKKREDKTTLSRTQPQATRSWVSRPKWRTTSRSQSKTCRSVSVNSISSITGLTRTAAAMNLYQKGSGEGSNGRYMCRHRVMEEQGEEKMEKVVAGRGREGGRQTEINKRVESGRRVKPTNQTYLSLECSTGW